MLHIQKVTTSDRTAEEEKPINLDYQVESSPIEWQEQNVQEHYKFISDISRYFLSVSNNLRCVL